MSYPPPPGLKTSLPSSSSSNAASHASLPPRPPPSATPLPPFKPASLSNPTSVSGAPGTLNFQAGHSPVGQSSFGAFKPRQVGGRAPEWQSQSQIVSVQPTPSSAFPTPSTYSSAGYGVQQQSYPPDSYGPSAVPQIRNPFPLPEHGAAAPRSGAGGRYQEAGVDPEMEAQIAQWQMAYAGNAPTEPTSGRGTTRSAHRPGFSTAEGSSSASGANAGPLGGRPEAVGPSMSSSAMASAADGNTGVASVVTGADGNQKTVVRSGGGQTWTDSSLLEWDPAHFRLFVGNLAGEVTDESLLKAFSKYPSVQKARVVRDKRTTKSRGYGFVSFSDGEEYFQAAREMQGKYIGSHPVLLRKSTTEIKAVVPGNKRGGKHGKGARAGGRGDSGHKSDAGIQKKSNKTKGGLKILG